MGWRTVNISSIAKVDLKLDKMVVRTADNTKMIHLPEIDTVVIENTATSITSSLLIELLKNKINVIFCDEKRNPFASLNSFYGAHDSSDKIRTQILWSNHIKEQIWTEIVRAKILHQMLFLKELEKEEYKTLEEYLNEIELADKTNREAFSAKVYFNSLFGMGFSRSQDNSINAALNYGYSLILSSVNRSVLENGYLTQLGVHHDNMFNYYNLSCDFMEPFRIIIDRKVYNMNVEKFEKEEKTEIIKCLDEEVLIDKKSQFVSNAIKIYVKSIIDAINDEDISLIKNFKVQNEL